MECEGGRFDVQPNTQTLLSLQASDHGLFIVS
jgi:hypothetical protein